MDREKLKIVDPCSQNFDKMQGDGHRRFCDQCEKSVHNLSDLTRREALQLLKDNRESGLCVVYTFDRSNKIRFRDDLNFRRPSKSQLSGLKRLLAAAAFVPLLAGLPACDPAPQDEVVLEQVGEPCDLPTSNSFKPIDEIIAAEKRFFQELADLFGPDDVPDYELIMGAMPEPYPEETMGEPMIEEIEPIEEVEPEPVVPPTPEHVQEVRMEMMGDIGPETIEQLQQDALLID